MGTIDNTQVPNSPADDDVLTFEFHEYGDLSTDSELCDSVGDVYNPLQDPHVTTPETRGTLDSFTIDDATETEQYEMAALLQNLGGKNSLVGRSIVLKDDDGTVSGCCVIGLDAPPAPTTPSYTPHYHPAQHYGYGGYGHHGHHGYRPW